MLFILQDRIIENTPCTVVSKNQFFTLIAVGLHEKPYNFVDRKVYCKLNFI